MKDLNPSCPLCNCHGITTKIYGKTTYGCGYSMDGSNEIATPCSRNYGYIYNSDKKLAEANRKLVCSPKGIKVGRVTGDKTLGATTPRDGFTYFSTGSHPFPSIFYSPAGKFGEYIVHNPKTNTQHIFDGDQKDEAFACFAAAVETTYPNKSKPQVASPHPLQRLDEIQEAVFGHKLQPEVSRQPKPEEALTYTDAERAQQVYEAMLSFPYLKSEQWHQLGVELRLKDRILYTWNNMGEDVVNPVGTYIRDASEKKVFGSQGCYIQFSMFMKKGDNAKCYNLQVEGNFTKGDLEHAERLFRNHDFQSTYTNTIG